jgi:formylglycine-generating enzyme required for sulfatase activity
MIAALALLLLQAAPEKERVNSIGIKLVRIEPGEFVMGDGAAPPRTREEWLKRDADESPAHPVKITKAFQLGATEVTCGQYRNFDPSRKGADAEPITHVTWDQAVAFCDWLSKKEAKPYRLPTEAEWEYACRAGTTTPFSSGETLAPEQANFKSAKAVPVGTFAPNPWGLHDLHGNVAEWCLDWYGPYEEGAQADPVGRADGIARVTRGGSFLMGSPRYARSANRSGQLPEDATRATGFRVVLGEKPATAPLPVPVVDATPALPPRAAPDSAKPYFLDFAKERRNPAIPKGTWGPIFSEWNHFTTICVCPNGDVLAAWYTTVNEEGRELAQASSRLRAGSDRWEPASLFIDLPDMNDHAPVLLVDGSRIYHFFTQSLRGWDDASDCVRVSGDSGATWSKPRIILSRDDPQRLSQPCSAFVAKDGTIVLACDGDNHRDERLITSSDGGKTWTVAKGDMRKTATKYAIHPAIVPRGDGSILAFMRGPDPMPMLVSKDLGQSWEPQETPFPGIGVGQKAAALRLASGAILLLSFDQKKQLVGGGTFAALSLDEGMTWPHVRKVEGVTGYMSVAQGRDGVIYAFGTRISCVAFNEAWVKEGK